MSERLHYLFVCYANTDRSPTAEGVCRRIATENGQFMATIVVGEKNKGPVKLTNCEFWGVPQTKEQVVKHGPSSLILNACYFTGCLLRGDDGMVNASGADVRMGLNTTR